MKKILFSIFLIFFSFNPLLALEDNFEKPVILEPEERVQEEEISPYTKRALRAIIEKEYDLNSTEGMFNKQLHAEFKKGLIKDTTAHMHFLFTFDESIDSKDSDFKYNINKLRLGFDGKFKSEKESYKILFDLTPSAFDNYSNNFLLDAYIQTTRLKNHKISLGASRPQVGIEGGTSSKLIPFLLRSQIARNFADVRKTGLKVEGEYKYVDYEIGGYSSDIRYHEFFPGVETALWLGFKPLAKFDDKYGRLYLAGGLNTGTKNSHDFTVASSALTYDYKKFKLQAEYAHAHGSNGNIGFTTNKAQGYNLTLSYMLTKKLQFLLRYDDFDSNKDIKNNNSREYSAGINWYILGQSARMMLNYVFCDNSNLKKDSHRIILGMQFIL